MYTNGLIFAFYLYMSRYLMIQLIALLAFSVSSCIWFVERPGAKDIAANDSSAFQNPTTVDSLQNIIDSFKKDKTGNIEITDAPPPPGMIDTKNIHPDELMRFSETLIGTPYVYASINPEVGFDCSGFITYVFKRFNIQVPRSSVDFTTVGKEIPIQQAKRGDIILFTGTNPAERHVGHMGLIVNNDLGIKDSTGLKFIHSSSGKAMGVTITPLNKSYQRRFVKVIRIFPQNDA